jgi:hypothetical protein
MPKPIRLRPVLEGNRYRLNVPEILSPTGRRQRLYFADLNGAKLKASELRTAQHNLRVTSDDFPESLKPDALRAINLIHSIDPNATLFQAARFFVDAANARSQSITFAELFDLYLSLKSDRSRVYLNELAITKRRLSHSRYPGLRHRSGSARIIPD